jgi:hypothetical protein
MTVIIGSKYDGPQYDKPCLRQLPREWRLEGVNYSPPRPWFKRVEWWAWILLALFLLVGAAQAWARWV